MSKYTKGEVQQIIDDLDFLKLLFPDEIAETSLGSEFVQARRSLMNASDILTELPDEVIEALDKKRDVFEPAK